MRTRDIRLGRTYRLKNHPEIGYAKAITILKPGEGENKGCYSIVKCKYTKEKNSIIGYIEYFLPSTLIKENPKEMTNT